MPLTTVDPTVALVVVDLQKGVLALPTVHPVRDIVQQAARLATAFRGHGLPVVLVNATGVAPGRTDASRRGAPRPNRGPDWADLADELDAQPGDIRISKQTWGAFCRTALDAELRERDVTQVVLAGVATSAGVESTARAAHEHGYHVVLATDAMTDVDADAHHNSVERIFPRIGETATTAEILALLDQRGG